MLPFLARALFGALVLVGLVNEHRRIAETAPESPGADTSAATPFVVPAAPVHLGGQPGYQKAKVYRIYRVTAYCDRGLTAAGVASGVGQCAAPADIPFGARIYIPALGRTFVVTDRTARRFRHNTVDLFIPDRAECKRFGRRYLRCEITLPTQAPRYGSPRLHAELAAAYR